jgi:type IV secretion system protein VirB6
MSRFCTAPDQGLGMVQGLLSSVDCNAQALAQAGYGALAGPGSPVEPVLTLALTLYIAFLGFRLMLGLGPLRVGELTMSALKIGVIVALATQWPTYQTLVFDVLLKVPEQLGAATLKSADAGVDPSVNNPLASLQAAYDELQKAALFYGGKSAPQTSPMLGGPGLGAMSLNLSAMLLLFNSLGVLLAAKIVLAILLSIGPVFIVLLLFDATRGLFEGWLRAALAFAFVPLLAVLGLVVELVMLRPEMMQLADLMGRGQLDFALPSAILLLCLIFALVTVALTIAVGVVAFGFRLPARQTPAFAARGGYGAPAIVQTTPFAAVSAYASPPSAARPERAAQIVRAAAALERRDARLTPAPLRAATNADPISLSRRSTPDERRTAQPRRAASNQRRDQ